MPTFATETALKEKDVHAMPLMRNHSVHRYNQQTIDIFVQIKTL